MFAAGADHIVRHMGARAMGHMHFSANRLDARPIRAFPVGRFILYLGVAAMLMHVAMGAALASVASCI